MTSAHRVLALAGHEYRAAVRNRLLATLLGILATVTIVSVYVGAVDYHGQLADYQAYLAAAHADGLTRVAPSPLAPLALLRGAWEYIEIVGAVIAITLGYLSVARERTSRTLPLLRTRPLSPAEHAAGSLLGALGIAATLVVGTGAVAVGCLGLVGGGWPHGGQIVKLLLAGLASILYLGIFFCLGALATAHARTAVNGLMLAMGLWLAIVLILPQIGDTLDADNQVPGGLFASLSLNHDQETRILTHFSTYERVRTGLEEVSLAKHYERFAFAMTDVKDRYRPFTLTRLLHEKRNDIAWLAGTTVALGIGLWHALRRQPTIPRQGAS